MMHMTFYWGRQVTLLFDRWKTTTWLGYVLSLLAVFLFSVFYQYMENLRARVQACSAEKLAESSRAETPLVSRISAAKPGSRKLAIAVLVGINSTIGYFLMLSVMSFNAGVLIAAVLGLAAGYLLFRGDGEIAVIGNACACA